MSAIQKIAVLAKSGWKIYAIIHLTTFLLFKRKKVLKKPLRTILKALFGLFRSLAFSATYGFWITWSLCYVTKFNRGRITGWNSTIMALGAVFSLYCEQDGRRNEIVMYQIPRTIESLGTFLGKRKLLPIVPYFLPLLSAFTWGVIAETHSNKKYPMKKTFKQILDFLLGNDEQYEVAKKGIVDQAPRKQVSFSEEETIMGEDSDANELQVNQEAASN